MESKIIPPDAICIRQKSEAIAEFISRSIAPIVAEKLAHASALGRKISCDGSTFVRKRIAVEFYYELTDDNPWGDFARWNITDTDVHTKSVATTTHHFTS